MQLAARDVQRPDVVVAAERIAAVRRERDARAVVRPDRLAIVERSPRELVLMRSVGRDRPDVVAAISIGEERDPFAVGRPHRIGVRPAFMRELGSVAAVGVHHKNLALGEVLSAGRA